MEVQQMKAQAREEKARKQVSKTMSEPPLSLLHGLGLGGKQRSWVDRCHLAMDPLSLVLYLLDLSWLVPSWWGVRSGNEE